MMRLRTSEFDVPETTIPDAAAPARAPDRRISGPEGLVSPRFEVWVSPSMDTVRVTTGSGSKGTIAKTPRMGSISTTGMEN